MNYYCCNFIRGQIEDDHYFICVPLKPLSTMHSQDDIHYHVCTISNSLLLLLYAKDHRRPSSALVGDYLHLCFTFSLDLCLPGGKWWVRAQGQ